MTVYVDALRPTPKSRKWPFGEGAHMLADSIDELHVFAQKLGLKRAWFQPLSSPHYDLNGRRHARALELGAKLIGRIELVALIKKLRCRHPSQRIAQGSEVVCLQCGERRSEYPTPEEERHAQRKQKELVGE